jgi:hypothetical protein
MMTILLEVGIYFASLAAPALLLWSFRAAHPLILLSGALAGWLPWIAADRLIKMMVRSPFQSWINDNAFLRFLFYRGMGARFPSTFLTGSGIKIPDPWALTVGHHVIMGDEAILSGHNLFAALPKQAACKADEGTERQHAA